MDARRGDLVAFGRPFISNPNLVAKLQAGARLQAPDPNTFYTPGDKGYTDHPPIVGDPSVATRSAAAEVGGCGREAQAPAT